MMGRRVKRFNIRGGAIIRFDRVHSEVGDRTPKELVMTHLPTPSTRDTSTRITLLRSQHDPRLTVVPLEPVRLRWSADSASADTRQLGYQVRSRSGGADWTEYEPVESAQSIDVGPSGAGEVDAAGIGPREIQEYSVRIATELGWTEWSDIHRVEGGVATGELSATVIGIDSTIEGPVPVLRTEFELGEEELASARLYVSALGIYNVTINGQPATDAVLSPGWTSYQERILLDTLDVTGLLVPGRNAIAVAVADGWFRGRMGFAWRTAIYGDTLGAIVQLEATGVHGEVTRVVSDESWRGGFGSIRSASIYDGTAIDFGFSTGDPGVVGFDDSDWEQARVVDSDIHRFEIRPVVPVRRIAELPMEQSAIGDGVRLDSGQNIAGWVKLRVEGRAGDVVTVRHAEVIEPGGEMHTAALRSAKATDTYVLDRDGEFDLEPQFTFHGFRYAEVTGARAVLEATAVAISSDLTARSTFSSSHPVLDRFHENVRWSQRDNFVSVPTDCPQRDERLGWTGDAQAFAPTANTLFDSEDFWGSWLRDLEADQTDEGGVASVVPNIIRLEDMIMGGQQTDTMGRAGWADAGAIVPMAVYESYGDPRILRQQLRSMRRWVAHLRNRAGADVLLPTEPFQYGDWLDPDAPGDRPWAAKVSSDFVANAFYVRSARLLSEAELLVGDPAAGADYAALADAVAAATWERWADEATSTQTGAALALEFEIAPDAERARVAEALAANVRAENGRISTGFLGTPLVLFALSNAGYHEEAFQMLLRRDAPSWLYQVDRGATTVWERWDAILPDGSIHSGEMDTKEGDSMLSFNHYAYGAMIDWVYRTVAGLAPLTPGYERVRIAPRPATALTSAQASIDTRFGELAIDWRLDDGDFVATIVVPFGVEAELDLPAGATTTVTRATDGTVGPVDVAVVRHGTYTARVTDAAVVEVNAPAV
jgi:alpha-L-rhamnosidase